MTIPVKFFHSVMGGAPVLSGTAGSLIAVLDACLVDGFDLKSADSIVISGGVATVNISAGHTYFALHVLQVSVSSLPALSGQKRVIAANATSFTFDATGFSDQTITGTISVKRAAAGWEKVYSGTNLAVYRSLDVTSTRMYLRVDDTGTTNARVVGYESMSDVNTGLFAFPTAPQVSGGGYWPKANASGAAARAWTIAADSKTFWLHMHAATSSAGANGYVWGFGDIKAYKSGDPYACVLQCSTNDISASQVANSQAVEYIGPGGHAGTFMPRSFTGLGSAPDIRHAPESLVTTGGVSGNSLSALLPNYPNGPDNGIYFTKKLIAENAFCLRGRSRGVLFPVQNCHYGFNWRDVIDGQGEYAGRKLYAIKCGSGAAVGSTGVMFFDITGPWE